GTVYRHFPTKGALLEELAADKINRLTAWAHEALTAGDPGEAFFAYLRREGELHAGDRPQSEGGAGGPGAFPRRGSSPEAPTAARGDALGRGQAAGGVRPDAGGADVGALMCGLGRAGATFGDQVSPQRCAEIVIAGLRARPGRQPRRRQRPRAAGAVGGGGRAGAAGGLGYAGARRAAGVRAA